MRDSHYYGGETIGGGPNISPDRRSMDELVRRARKEENSYQVIPDLPLYSVLDHRGQNEDMRLAVC